MTPFLFAVVDTTLQIAVLEAQAQEYNAGMLTLPHVAMAQAQIRARLRTLGWWRSTWGLW